MTGARTMAWERALRQALDAVDHALEERFGDALPRHPSRPRRQSTANPRYDGLFTLDGKFSLGLVSRSGPGYVVDIRIASPRTPTPELWEAVLTETERALRQALAAAFPSRDLDVTRAGPTVLRITGDLSL